MKKGVQLAAIPLLLVVALVWPESRALIFGTGGATPAAAPVAAPAAPAKPSNPVKPGVQRRAAGSVAAVARPQPATPQPATPQPATPQPATPQRAPKRPATPQPTKTQRRNPELADEARLQRLHARRQSGVWLQVRGRVVKLLPDDRDGDQHQRFLVKVGRRVTLLVAHNIDLAPRAPVRRGSEVWIRGRFEDNDRGGVLHWTHRDPRGRRSGPRGAGGWIEVDGKRVR